MAVCNPEVPTAKRCQAGLSAKTVNGLNGMEGAPNVSLRIGALSLCIQKLRLSTAFERTGGVVSLRSPEWQEREA